MPETKNDKRVLILGGTAEARALADALAREKGAIPTLSLAGVTAAPSASAARTRHGGFGGAEGLARYLREQRIAALIDATHPFAARISRNAASAAQNAGAPLLRLERPAWTPKPAERWRRAASIEDAAAAPPAGARVFLAIGPGSAAPFARRPDLWCALRRIDPTDAPFPLAQGEWAIGRPATDEAEERRLFERLKIDWLIAKNSGGRRAKLDAAHALGIPVAMVDRPPQLDDVLQVETVEEALRWARVQFGAA